MTRLRATFILLLAVLFSAVLVDGVLRGPLWRRVHDGLIGTTEILVGIGLAVLVMIWKRVR